MANTESYVIYVLRVKDGKTMELQLDSKFNVVKSGGENSEGSEGSEGTEG